MRKRLSVNSRVSWETTYPGCHKVIYGCYKDNTDDIRITYRLVAGINYTWHPQTFYGKFKQFEFFRKRFADTTHITDATDVLMDENYDL